MKSAWVDSDARKAVDHWAKTGVGAELAQRIYSTRLLGCDPRRVLHGGGNTSGKTRVKDLFGDDADVLCVKGSGWDMANIEPGGCLQYGLNSCVGYALARPCRTQRWCARSVRR